MQKTDTITLPRAVVEQVLEALEYERDANNPLDWHHDKTMTALRSALKQPQQEPVVEHQPCQGMNCGITRTDQEHSLECQAEHAACIAGGTFVKPAQQEPKKDLMWSTVAMQKRHDERIGRIVNTLEQIKQEQLAEQPASLDWVSLNKAADEIVRSKPTWKRFIDGTPLANDIACWMADFALEHTHPAPRTERPRSLTDEEIMDVLIALNWDKRLSLMEIARTIEARILGRQP